MYLENVPPKWLIKILEQYVNDLKVQNEHEVRRRFWIKCIYFTFFYEIKIKVLYPEYLTNKKEFKIACNDKEGSDILRGLDDENLDKFISQFLYDISNLKREDFDKLMKSSGNENTSHKYRYYIFGLYTFPTILFWDIWLIFIERIGFDPIHKMNFSPAKIFFLEYMEDFYARQR